MPNCDFGRPCDCIDCCTVIKQIKCPNCNFVNRVKIIRNAKYEVDRKGIGYYDFTEPTEPIKDLNCFKCGYLIENVCFYSEIAIESNKREREKKIEQGRICSECQKVEEMDFLGMFGEVVLKNKNGKNLCQECYAKVMKEELSDPSNEKEKYYFDDLKCKWVLEKIKLPCEVCGKERWLNADNKWKKMCLRCYKESRK
ncbi:MAG TPA: hypothetical protein VMZ29_09235 [Candidatus Bathyarchaeia archaeon]|nr:hypothetical protein [Candidatus Bathyarchaeia archaeon]